MLVLAKYAPAASVVSLAFWTEPLPSVKATPSADWPVSPKSVWPVPQTHVCARGTDVIAAVLYSAAGLLLMPVPPALPVIATRCTFQFEPHCTTITVLVAAERPPSVPSRVQSIWFAPDGLSRTWQTSWSSAVPSAVLQPAPLTPPISIT